MQKKLQFSSFIYYKKNTPNQEYEFGAAIKIKLSQYIYFLKTKTDVTPASNLTFVGAKSPDVVG